VGLPTGIRPSGFFSWLHGGTARPGSDAAQDQWLLFADKRLEFLVTGHECIAFLLWL